MRLCDALACGLAQLLAELAGDGAASALEPIGDGEGLLLAEEALLARAVPSRRREFAAGRRCARRALRAVGCPPAPLPIGPLGAPIWPPGFSGSITHDRRFAAAIAYRSESGRVTVSLDMLERVNDADFLEIAETVTTADERRSGRQDPADVARLFSAKEAAIKILSPALGRLLDFQELTAVAHGEELAVTMAGNLTVLVRSIEIERVIISLGRLRCGRSTGDRQRPSPGG